MNNEKKEHIIKGKPEEYNIREWKVPHKEIIIENRNK